MIIYQARIDEVNNYLSEADEDDFYYGLLVRSLSYLLLDKTVDEIIEAVKKAYEDTEI